MEMETLLFPGSFYSPRKTLTIVIDATRLLLFLLPLGREDMVEFDFKIEKVRCSARLEMSGPFFLMAVRKPRDI